MVKNLSAMQETQVWSLGQEHSLEKGIATHSSILAWRIPWREEAGGPQSMGHKELDMTEWLSLTMHMYVYVYMYMHIYTYIFKPHMTRGGSPSVLWASLFFVS